MRGFPGTVATIQDVMNLKDKYPKETKKFLDKLISTEKDLISKQNGKNKKGPTFSLTKKIGFVSIEEAQLVLDSINIDLIEPESAKLFKFK
jgi:hypothetical protein